MQECFDPIIDITTGKDLIPALVYGYEYNDLFQSFVSLHTCAIHFDFLLTFLQEEHERAGVWRDLLLSVDLEV